MAALAAGFPAVVGERLAAYQEAMRTQRAITQPLPLTPGTSLGKRKRDGAEATEEYNAELERDRYLNDMKLKTRFEHIFSKYGQDFEGVADEVDLQTGELVVDNGHLQHMRTDLDLGRAHGGRLAEMLGSEQEDTDDRAYEEESGNESWVDQDQDDTDDSWPGGTQRRAGNNRRLESDDEAGEVDFQRGSEEPDDVMSIMVDNDLVADPDNEEEAGGFDSNKDVWNDAPKLPGDEGYDPFADSTGKPGLSSNVLKVFESGVSDQITQLVNALQQVQGQSQAQIATGLKPQITIDLDPTSASYGKPVITYSKVEVQKQQPAKAATPANLSAELHRQKKTRSTEELLRRPKEIATNVLGRIADAGLPTVPGPDGKFPTYKRARSRQRGLVGPTRIMDGAADASDPEDSDAPIDPALEATTATEMQEEAAAAAANGVSCQVPDSVEPETGTHAPDRILLPPGAPFSEEDDELILELRDNRNMGWEDIRDLCFADRRVTALQYRYYTYLKSDCNTKFADEDDRLLKQLREVDSLPWAAIQRDYFTEFKVSQLQYRYYSKLCEVRNKSQWTQEQDGLLVELKERQGLTWQQIRDEHFPKLSLGQLQYRYYTSVRPADWKEQVVALTEAFDQAEPNAVDGATMPRSGSSIRPAKQGSLIWSLRRRLAGASDKLTETKKRQSAEKRRKLEEKKRREAARLAAQEEKRQAREALNVAKLKAIRAAQEAAKADQRFNHRDIASVSPVPQIASDAQQTPCQSRSTSPSSQMIIAPQTAMEQFEAAIAQYEDYQDPRRALGVKLCRRSLAAEEDEMERRQDQRYIFEQALQMGALILPKPAAAEDVPAALSRSKPPPAPSSLPPVLADPQDHTSRHPWLPPVNEALPGLDAMRSKYSVIHPIDVRMYAPAPPLPQFYMCATPPAPPTSNSPTPLDCDEDKQRPEPTAPAMPLGPTSRVWIPPNTHQPTGNVRPPNSRSQSATGKDAPARRPQIVAVPFPSRSPVLSPVQSLPGGFATELHTESSTALHATIDAQTYDESIHSAREEDGDDALTISEAHSPVDMLPTDSEDSSETAPVLSDAPIITPRYSHRVSAYAGPPLPSTREAPDKAGIHTEEHVATHRSPVHVPPRHRSGGTRAPNKRVVVEDSESDIPSSVSLSSDDNDSDSDEESGSEDASGEMIAERKALRTTDPDASDDELTNHGGSFGKYVLSARKRRDIVADPHMTEKATPPRRQPSQTKDRSTKAPISSGAYDAHLDDDDDELA